MQPEGAKQSPVELCISMDFRWFGSPHLQSICNLVPLPFNHCLCSEEPNFASYCTREGRGWAGASESPVLTQGTKEMTPCTSLLHLKASKPCFLPSHISL